jgi:hypothetical protein
MLGVVSQVMGLAGWKFKDSEAFGISGETEE